MQQLSGGDCINQHAIAGLNTASVQAQHVLSMCSACTRTAGMSC